MNYYSNLNHYISEFARLMRKVATSVHLFWAPNFVDYKSPSRSFFDHIQDIKQYHKFMVRVKKIPYYTWRCVFLLL